MCSMNFLSLTRHSMPLSLKPLSMKLHALTGFWVSNSLQILSGIHTFFLLPKKQERWLVLSLEPGISLHLLLFTISSRAKSVRGWSTVVTFGLALQNALFPVWIECNVECVGSWVMRCSRPYSHFLIDATLLV